MGLATRLKLIAWHVLLLLLSGAVIALALRFADGRLKVWLVTGGAIVVSLILIQYIVFIVHKIECRIYEFKFGKSGEWNYIAMPFGTGCMMIFGSIIFSLLSFYFLLISIFGIYFDIQNQVNLISRGFFGALFLSMLLLAVMSARASYRFLFVRTRYNETHFERWGPLGRPRRLAFKQIRRAGFNPFMSTIWIEPKDGGRMIVWENEFGADKLYAKLHYELRARFKGDAWRIDDQLKQGGQK